jgi:hypothetical protein
MGYAFDIVLVILTQLLFFAGGWAFFVRKISGEYKVENGLVLSLFAATFSLSCTLFELIIFEILDILQRRFELEGVWIDYLWIVSDGFCGS